MFTKSERATLRAKIGTAFLGVQEDYRKQGYAADQVVPEIVAALLSLTAMIASESAGMGPAGFILASRVAAREQWGIEADPL
jgi:hypothetical protein